MDLDTIWRTQFSEVSDSQPLGPATCVELYRLPRPTVLIGDLVIAQIVQGSMLSLSDDPPIQCWVDFPNSTTSSAESRCDFPDWREFPCLQTIPV